MSDDAETKIIIADRDYWRNLAPENFGLVGFTYRSSALFICKDDGCTIDVTMKHLEFFGVNK